MRGPGRQPWPRLDFGSRFRRGHNEVGVFSADRCAADTHPFPPGLINQLACAAPVLTEQGVSKSAATAGRVRAEGLPLCFIRHDFFELLPQLLWISGL